MLKLIIGLRLLDDHGATGRYIGAGRGKPAPTVGCLPTTISYTRLYPYLLLYGPWYAILNNKHANRFLIRNSSGLLAACGGSPTPYP